MPIRNWSTTVELVERNTARDGECWIWQRAVSHKNTSAYGQGYGVLWVGRKCLMAHRYLYEHLREPIDDGKQLHHRCGQTRCVNPAHLLAVTPKEHVQHNTDSCALRSHCPRGHAYTADNTKHVFTPGSNGKKYHKRICRACHRADNRRRKAERKAAA